MSTLPARRGVELRLPLLGLACLLAFVALAVRAADGGGFAWDAPVSDLLDTIAPVESEEIHPDPILGGITFVLTALVALAGLVLLVRRRVRDAVFLGASIVGAVVLSTLVKALVDRPPIEGGGDSSFPSGSATWSMALTAAVVLLARGPRERRLAVVAGGLFVVAYGALITFEEWHYASDVLAGWCLALAWVAAVRLVLYRSYAPASGALWGRARPSKSPPGENSGRA
jgi:membrane-associated phospholipid phosphatase